MYLNKVLLPAKRVVAKKRATRITKIHLDNVSQSLLHRAHAQSDYTQDNMDDTASVITDLTDAQIESVDVNLDLIENWNELELREAQVCTKYPMLSYLTLLSFFLS